MDTCLLVAVIVLAILFLAYFLIDVNYFIRSLFTILHGKFFREKLGFLGVSEIYGIVLPSDADLWITHCNNGRVFREFDFGRWDHLTRSGLLKLAIQKKGGGVVASQTIRYRRPLHMFMTYKVVTTPMYFDTNSIYFEQKIVTLRDDIIRAVAYVRLVMNLDFNKIVSVYYPITVKPDLPEDLEQWIKFNKCNSQRLNPIKMLTDKRENDALKEDESS